MLVINPASGFRKAALKKLLYFVVGIWGRFSRQDQKIIQQTFAARTRNREFQFPDPSKKIPCSFWAPMVLHEGLSTVNCAACHPAPCVNESPKLQDFPVKFPVSRKLQRERGLLETARSTKDFPSKIKAYKYSLNQGWAQNEGTKKAHSISLIQPP
jgi:hypothetical protein